MKKDVYATSTKCKPSAIISKLGNEHEQKNTSKMWNSIKETVTVSAEKTIWLGLRAYIDY